MSEEYKKAFIRVGKAWYSKNTGLKDDKLTVGCYHEEGGTSGEFILKWVDLGSNSFPQLQAFNDSWKILYEEFKELLEVLSLDKYEGPLSIEEMVKILLDLGIEDQTPYENPEGKSQFLIKKNTERGLLSMSFRILIEINAPYKNLLRQKQTKSGWVPYEIPSEVFLHTRMHLNQDQVKALLPILEKFVRTGTI